MKGKGAVILGVHLTTIEIIIGMVVLLVLLLLTGFALFRRLRSPRSVAAPVVEEKQIDLSSRLGKLIDGTPAQPVPAQAATTPAATPAAAPAEQSHEEAPATAPLGAAQTSPLAAMEQAAPQFPFTSADATAPLGTLSPVLIETGHEDEQVTQEQPLTASQTADLSSIAQPPLPSFGEQAPETAMFFSSHLGTQEISGFGLDSIPNGDPGTPAGAQAFDYREFTSSWHPIYVGPSLPGTTAGQVISTWQTAPLTLPGLPRPEDDLPPATEPFPEWPASVPSSDAAWATVESEPGSTDARGATNWLTPDDSRRPGSPAAQSGSASGGTAEPRGTDETDLTNRLSSLRAGEDWPVSPAEQPEVSERTAEHTSDEDSWGLQPMDIENLSTYPVSPVVEGADPELPRRRTGGLVEDADSEPGWETGDALSGEAPATAMLPEDLWPAAPSLGDGTPSDWTAHDATRAQPALAGEGGANAPAVAPVAPEMVEEPASGMTPSSGPSELIVGPAQKQALEAQLATILTHPGTIRAALVRRDGTAVAGSLHQSSDALRDVSIDAVLTATLAASIRCTGFANFGAFDSLTITGRENILLLVEAGPLGLLGLLVRKDAKMGLLRRSLRRQIEAIRDTLAAAHVS